VGAILEFRKVWVQILVNGGAGSNPTNQNSTWVKGILVIERSMAAELN